MTVSRQKVVGVLRAKGFEAGKANLRDCRDCRSGYCVTQMLDGSVGVAFLPASFGTSLGKRIEVARSYLAALTAAGIQAHLGDDGRTVVVPVEQEGLGGRG